MHKVSLLTDLIEGDSNRFYDDVFTWGQFLSFFTQKDVFTFIIRGENNEWCGHIVFRNTVDEAEILTLYVKEVHRQQGFGRALMDAAIGHAKLLGIKTIFLDVRSANLPARKLYEDIGETFIATRPNYYAATPTQPQDDAVVYQLHLS